MSDPELPVVEPIDRGENEESDTGDARGSINLWVVYGLIFLGLLVAIGLAMLIVLPFYQRR